MTTSTPAPPMLGSLLLSVAESRASQPPQQPVSSSGVTTIDEAALLKGRFRYGEITAIAGAGATGKTLLSYQAVASHLLGGGAEAALIDTTGGFSPVRLRDVLVSRMGERDGEERVVDEAMGLMERVKVMRVFDLAGVVEAVGEVGEMRERVGARMEDAVGEGARMKRREVGDSEEESEEDILDDCAMERMTSANLGPKEGLVGMVIIDSITNVISSVVSKSPIQGHALLASFMRSLQHFTSRYQICTILINSAVGLNPSANPEYHRRPDDNVSIFSSSLGKPALGKTFTNLIDTSIYLSMIPKTREDGAIAYGDHTEGRTWHNAVIFEILKDRHGSREGRWTAFEIAGGVKIVPYFI